jgi:hypothetical protein
VFARLCGTAGIQQLHGLPHGRRSPTIAHSAGGRESPRATRAAQTTDDINHRSTCVHPQTDPSSAVVPCAVS